MMTWKKNVLTLLGTLVKMQIGLLLYKEMLDTVKTIQILSDELQGFFSNV